MGSLIAGVDCSTQATKVLVVGTGTGTVVAQGRAGHTVPASGSAETDPREWWQALGTALEETGRAAELEAIAVGGQQHGLVALGADGAPPPGRDALERHAVRPQAAALTEGIGAERLAGPRRFAAGRLVHRDEMGVAARARTGDRRLDAGNPPPPRSPDRATHRQRRHRPRDASGTAWWSSGDEAYARDILDHPAPVDRRGDAAPRPRAAGGRR